MHGHKQLTATDMPSETENICRTASTKLAALRARMQSPCQHTNTHTYSIYAHPQPHTQGGSTVTALIQ